MGDGSSLAAVTAGVEANPVFAMSLGSRELFHSNLLAWFINHHRPAAEALGLDGDVTALREKNHTDLLIRHGRAQVTVIENKVFALPNTSQLDRLSNRPGAVWGSRTRPPALNWALGGSLIFAEEAAKDGPARDPLLGRSATG